MKGKIRWGVVLISLVLVAGCAAPARMSRMRAKVLESGKDAATTPLRDNIAVSMTVTTHVTYVLANVRSEREIYGGTISVDSTATVSDALYGTRRLQIATEYSAQKNIAAFIERLLQLNVSQGDVPLP